jgi:hypothetical protein
MCHDIVHTTVIGHPIAKQRMSTTGLRIVTGSLVLPYVFSRVLARAPNNTVGIKYGMTEEALCSGGITARVRGFVSGVALRWPCFRVVPSMLGGAVVFASSNLVPLHGRFRWRVKKNEIIFIYKPVAT